MRISSGVGYGVFIAVTLQAFGGGGLLGVREGTAEGMGKTSMAAAVGRGASAVGKTSVAAEALAAVTAALASIVERAGLANSAVA